MNKSKLKINITAIAFCVLFLITTLCLLFTAGGTYSFAAGTTKSLKFMQVEVGADFAIGLTYEGDVYGWSLKPDARERAIDSSFVVTAQSETLGTYYPKTPIKIDFKFVTLNFNAKIKTDGTANVITIIGAEPIKDSETQFNISNERVVSIATTSTTAALLTKSGLIYTWGLDVNNEPHANQSNTKKNLLMRDATNGSSSKVEYKFNKNYYIPGLINYSTAPVSRRLLPIKSKVVDETLEYGGISESISLRGSESNYIVSGKIDGKDTMSSFVWGSNFYQQYNNKPDMQLFEKTPVGEIIASADGTKMYMGGNTLIQAATNAGARVISAMGKNFYTTTDAVDASHNSPALSTVTLKKMFDVSTAPDKKTASYWLHDGTTYYQDTDSVFTQFTQVQSGVALSTDTISAPAFFNADGSAGGLIGNIPASAKEPYDKISMGNGFGYMLTTAGIETIGNKTNNHSPTNSTAKPVEIVAGKTISGQHMISGAGGVSSAEPVTKLYSPVTAGSFAENKLSINAIYQDSKDFISAYLLADGTVKAWGTVGSATILDTETTLANQFKKYNFSGNNKIVKLSAGYGNVLYAISSYGKVFEIKYNVDNSSFDVKMLDSFDQMESNTVTSIENWVVNTAASKVEFEPTYLDKEVVVSQALIGLNGSTALNGNGTTEEADSSKVKFTDNKPVLSNLSADVYRIIMPTSQIGSGAGKLPVVKAINADGSANSLNVNYSMDSSATSISSGSVPQGGDFKFYWANSNKTEIPLNVVKQYFEIELVYVVNDDAAKDTIAIKVKPLKSTQNQDIIITYVVGRFDNALKMRSLLTNNAGLRASDFTFYDFKTVELKVKIANTSATASFENKLTDGTDNSIVPVLDPNNPFSKNYSLALMDVSTGFIKLADSFGAINNVDASAFKTALLDGAKANDIGFPDVNKVSGGHLAYYGIAGFYNDTYKYIAKDHDGDIIQINKKSDKNDDIFEMGGLIDYSTYFNGKVKQISYSIDVSAYINDANFEKANVEFNKVPENNNQSYFANQYGFELRLFKDSNNSYKLELKYDVITVSATGSMQNLKYTNNDVAKPESKVPADLSSKGAVYALQLTLLENTPSETSKPRVFSNGLVVYTQSSASLKEKIKGKAQNLGAHQVYGNTSDEAASSVGLDNIRLLLGVENNSLTTFNVSDFVDNATNITFAHNQGNRPEDYQQFINSFSNDSLSISLDKNTLSFMPKTTGTHRFSIQLKRYNNEKSLISNSIDSETITIKFVLTVENNLVFGLKTDRKPKYTINKATSILLKDQILPIDDAIITKYMSVEVSSTNNAVVNAIVSSDKLSFLLTPGVSGEAIINFEAKLFNQEPICGSFTVVTATLCTYPSTITIVDYKDVSVSDLASSVRRLNPSIYSETLALNYKAEDPTSLPFYYQVSTTNEQGEKVWENTDDITKSKFLNSVLLTTDKKRIKITISSLESTDIVSEVRIVVKFKSSADSLYEIAIKVAPSAQTVVENGKAMQITLNKAAGTALISSKTDPTAHSIVTTLRGEKTYFKIPVMILTEIVFFEDRDKYDIIAVFSGNEKQSSEEFIDVDSVFSDLLIFPKRPTDTLADNRCPVQISVQKRGTTDVNLLTIYVTIDGIKTTLPKSEYQTVVIAVFFSVLGLLIIIFIIRLGVYWRKKAAQKRIIRKNQLLIKMRDKMHNKVETVSKEQIVRTKLKMEDPKYTKMFTEMRKDKEEQSGITLDNSAIAKKVETKNKAKNVTKGKKGGKKSIEDLKAELEAKRAKFAQMQTGDMSGMAMDDVNIPPVFEAQNNYSDSLTREEVENQIKAKLSVDDILLDVETISPEDNNN